MLPGTSPHSTCDALLLTAPVVFHRRNMANACAYGMHKILCMRLFLFYPLEHFFFFRIIFRAMATCAFMPSHSAIFRDNILFSDFSLAVFLSVTISSLNIFSG